MCSSDLNSFDTGFIPYLCFFFNITFLNSMVTKKSKDKNQNETEGRVYLCACVCNLDTNFSLRHVL